MPTAHANGIDLCYDSFGSPADPTLLLVMGLGAQMIRWEPGFCEKIAAHGFHVVRFDNRDVGLSSKIEGGPMPDFAAAIGGDTSSASYTLWDMADDTAGLLDHLGVERAHIVGASMGGMIVQAMAIRHPDRVLSMTSIMSTTGGPDVGGASDEARAILMAPRPENREEAIAAGVRSSGVIGSPAYPAAEATLAARVAESYDRCNYPIGIARQMLAVVATGDRTEALRGLRLPVAVIHGSDDPLVGVSGGEATAAAIPGATMHAFPGMGHDLPEQLWEDFTAVIVANARKAAPTAAPVRA